MSAEEARRQRYRDRQERIRQQRQEEIRQQRRELMSAMREQMQRIGEYDIMPMQQQRQDETNVVGVVVDLVDNHTYNHHHTNNVSDPFHQIDVLGEQLLHNTEQFQQLGREIFDSCKARWQELLESLEEMRETVMELSSSRKTTMCIERIDNRRRLVRLAMEQGEQDQIRHDEDIDDMKSRIVRLLERFRYQARYQQSLYSLPILQEEQGMDLALDYHRSSTGNITTYPFVQNVDEYMTPMEVTTVNDGSLLLAKFDGTGNSDDSNDIIPINDVICVVCMVEYDDGDEILRNAIHESHDNACNHFFHKECIMAWIRMSRKRECPCCRRPFLVTI